MKCDTTADFPPVRWELEGSLEMIDAHELAGSIERHADRVEAHHVGVRAFGALDQPAPGHLADPSLLDRVQRVERAAAAGGDAARLDFAKCEHSAVERDDVQLAPAGSVVALDDRETSADQMLGGELLADLAEAMTRGRLLMPLTLRRDRVTCGLRNVTIQEHFAKLTDAELVHAVTHA